MPERFTLDASVAAKWFNNEALTDKALQIRDAFVRGKIDLMAPEQLLYEVGNSIWKNKALTVEEAARAVKDLVDLQVELIHMNPELAASTMKAARDSRISFYDAAYLTLANYYDAPLISADTGILSKSKKNIVHLKDFPI
jgi:predicted nucleic acid-binding protein